LLSQEVNHEDHRSDERQGRHRQDHGRRRIFCKGVNVVVTGQVGGNANKGLEVAGIPTYAFGEATTVAEAYVAYKAGTLARIV
jgi:predicted Fe-Mo cluster-binding NifX family protein